LEISADRNRDISIPYTIVPTNCLIAQFAGTIKLAVLIGIQALEIISRTIPFLDEADFIARSYSLNEF